MTSRWKSGPASGDISRVEKMMGYYSEPSVVGGYVSIASVSGNLHLVPRGPEPNGCPLVIVVGMPAPPVCRRAN